MIFSLKQASINPYSLCFLPRHSLVNSFGLRLEFNIVKTSRAARELFNKSYNIIIHTLHVVEFTYRTKVDDSPQLGIVHKDQILGEAHKQSLYCPPGVLLKKMFKLFTKLTHIRGSKEAPYIYTKLDCTFLLFFF